MGKKDRGFASMDRTKQREIARKGGKAAHLKGTAHEWSSEEAREAGRKGGMASHRKHQQEIAHESVAEDQRVEQIKSRHSATSGLAVEFLTIIATTNNSPRCAGERTCTAGPVTAPAVVTNTPKIWQHFEVEPKEEISDDTNVFARMWRGRRSRPQYGCVRADDGRATGTATAPNADNNSGSPAGWVGKSNGYDGGLHPE
jgi:general stress protein YciG